jgi:ubiquinone/menaquinone biosynthesis C-methylase UbiE
VNTSFKKGLIEDLTTAHIPDASVDVVISNCVLNLAADKGKVLAEVWRVLKPGGELYFSDVFTDRRVPPEAMADKVSATWMCPRCMLGPRADACSLVHFWFASTNVRTRPPTSV